MKIAFIHDWGVPVEEQFCYEDGIRKAVDMLAERHKVIWITKGKLGWINYKSYEMCFVMGDSPFEHVDRLKPDVLLCWGSLDRPWHRSLHERYPKIPKVLCFAGGPTDHIAKSYFNVIVCESQVYIDEFTKIGVTAMRGFGTNTKVFRPDTRMTKKFDAIYPASLCFHKNIELFCRAMEDRGLVVGNHNEASIASKVLSLHTSLLHRVDSVALRDLYNMSRVTVVTGGPGGGAQRVVLESMACGIPVVVMSDNDRCVEFVRESGFGKVCEPIETEIRDVVDELIGENVDPMEGRAYIVENWSEDHYMKSLEKACEMAVSNGG